MSDYNEELIKYLDTAEVSTHVDRLKVRAKLKYKTNNPHKIIASALGDPDCSANNVPKKEIQYTRRSEYKMPDGSTVGVFYRRLGFRPNLFDVRIEVDDPFKDTLKKLIKLKTTCLDKMKFIYIEYAHDFYPYNKLLHDYLAVQGMIIRQKKSDMQQIVDTYYLGLKDKDKQPYGAREKNPTENGITATIYHKDKNDPLRFEIILNNPSTIERKGICLNIGGINNFEIKNCFQLVEVDMMKLHKFLKKKTKKVYGERFSSNNKFEGNSLVNKESKIKLLQIVAWESLIEGVNSRPTPNEMIPVTRLRRELCRKGHNVSRFFKNEPLWADALFNKISPANYI